MTATTHIRYLVPATIGAGVLDRLPQALARAEVRRPLIVTDAAVMARHGALLTDHLPADAVVFDQTPGNPDAASVVAAAAVCRAANCDGIVGFGGGSPMDLAKATAALVATGGTPAALMIGAAQAGAIAALPWIAVPTTAGTGSELSATAVIRLDGAGKALIASPKLLARAALCDPRLTLGAPRWLVAATGMDAITHCVEAICAIGDDPAAEAVAAEGLRLAVRDGALRRAWQDNDDLEARHALMTVSCLGALAFVKGLGAVHAATHALGAWDGGRLHHGTLNAILLPAVLRHNAPAIGRHLPRLAGAIGLDEDADAQAIAEAFAALSAELDLPQGLASLGVPREAIPALAGTAARDICSAANPRLMTATDYVAVLDAAWA